MTEEQQKIVMYLVMLGYQLDPDPYMRGVYYDIPHDFQKTTTTGDIMIYFKPVEETSKAGRIFRHQNTTLNFDSLDDLIKIFEDNTKEPK